MTTCFTRQRRLLRALTPTLLLACVVPLKAASPERERTPARRHDCSGCCESIPQRAVSLRIYNQPEIGDAGIARILETANRIWKPYGVSIAPGTDSDAITVVVSRTANKGDSDSRVLGDTLFSSGHATPYIRLWPVNAESLANASEMDGRSFTSRTRDEQHAILLQMMGVALAHELAHYLLDTSRHSAEGLLRESIGVTEFAFPNLGHLHLTTQQQQLLVTRFADTMARWDGAAMRDQ
jgi:hypothetical protein